MRFTTDRRYQPTLQQYLEVTTLHLDCGHRVTYYGSAANARERLKDNGGTIAGNLSRCKECTGRYRALVQNEIRQARETSL